jgi:hypothetical protein
VIEQGRLPFEDDGAAADLEWFREWAATIRWTFAKTVPDQPHEYWRAGGAPDYPRVLELIRRHGTSRSWPPETSELHGKIAPRTYRYLQVGDFEYWIGPAGFVNRGRPGRLD